jgi:hypothetical protein
MFGVIENLKGIFVVFLNYELALINYNITILSLEEQGGRGWGCLDHV